jgi:hypothetical protein
MDPVKRICELLTDTVAYRTAPHPHLELEFLEALGVGLVEVLKRLDGIAERLDEIDSRVESIKREVY